ncbi:MAG TPA: hypothetical protein VM124_00480 [Candidatus Limnocylindrales bacterium]|nr:hypothetical protein [Candidatus Limnocylindrales bacterium]
MADFSNFELGDDVMTLAGGLLPEMAEIFEVDLGQRTAEDIGRLIGRMGASQVLQENIPLVQERLGTDQSALEIAANWLDRSGVQKSLNRSLWTPSLQAPKHAVTVMTGAVANWQDRTAYLVADASREAGGGEVYIPIGTRVMDSVTEKTNFNVDVFFSDSGRYPTEAEYAGAFVVPLLEAAGNNVFLKPYNTTNGQEIAERFFEDEPMLYASGYITFARVANAGILLAGQFVRAARDSGFDQNSNDPQAFVRTDTFPVARTEAEVKNPKEYQNPFTGIRQIAVTAKEIVLLAA